MAEKILCKLVFSLSNRLMNVLFHNDRMVIREKGERRHSLSSKIQISDDLSEENQTLL